MNGQPVAGSRKGVSHSLFSCESSPSSHSDLRHIYGPRWPWLFILYFSLTVICGYVSWSKVVIDERGVVYTNQTAVEFLVSTTSDKPEGLAAWPQMRSRILIPYLLVGAKKHLGIPYRVTHDGLRLGFIFLAAILFHWHLRTWFSLHEALTGTVLLLGTITITFNNWIPISTDFPELVGMTICVAALLRQRWALMLVTLSLYTLTRETSVLLLIAAVCVLYTDKTSIPKVLAIAVSIFMTWWISYMTARYIAGIGASWFANPGGSGEGQGFMRELVGMVQDLWSRRLASIMSLVRNPHPYNVNWSVFLVMNVFWVLPLTAWRAVPSPLKRLYFAGLLGGLVLFFLVGVLNEAGRHMIPLYPLIYPAGLYVLFRSMTPSGDLLATAPRGQM